MYNVDEVANNSEISPVIINLGSGINPIEINNYLDLREFIINNDLTGKQIEKLIQQTLSVLVFEPLPKNQFILDLDDFYKKWIENKQLEERPLFLKNLTSLVD